jgi:hypothetical protein
VAPGIPATSFAVPVPAQGRVRLVNTYVTDMTATVNGLTYVVPPMQSRDVPVPVGPLTYQVQQAQMGRSTTINPNETITLTLFPAVL